MVGFIIILRLLKFIFKNLFFIGVFIKKLILDFKFGLLLVKVYLNDYCFVFFYVMWGFELDVLIVVVSNVLGLFLFFFIVRLM